MKKLIGSKAIKILITHKMLESKAAHRGSVVAARRWVAASRG